MNIKVTIIALSLVFSITPLAVGQSSDMGEALEQKAQSETAIENADTDSVEEKVAKPIVDVTDNVIETLNPDGSEESSEVPNTPKASNVLLMPVKSEIRFITTGGSELRADWIETAETNLFGHMESEVAGRGLSHVSFDDDSEKSDGLNQLMLLADVVQSSSMLQLPHKPQQKEKNVMGNNSGLTLGSDISLLKMEYDAERAIFLHNFGAIESSGVQAAKWGAAILSQGSYVPNLTSARGTYASVFDMETGELVSHQFVLFGDSRDPTESQRIVTRVFENLDID